MEIYQCKGVNITYIKRKRWKTILMFVEPSWTLGKFGHNFYILAYSGLCQKSEPVDSCMSGVWWSSEFNCAYDHLDIIIDTISLPVHPNVTGKLKWRCSCILNVFIFVHFS